eukprot:4516567-Prymnesium_polylepis.1
MLEVRTNQALELRQVHLLHKRAAAAAAIAAAEGEAFGDEKLRCVVRRFAGARGRRRWRAASRV